MTEIGFIQALPMGALGDNRTSMESSTHWKPRPGCYVTDLERYPLTVALLRVWALEDQLENVWQALDYDLRGLAHEEGKITGAAARLWRANWAAWKLIRGF